MFAYLEGRIEEVRLDHIVLDVQGIGYMIVVGKPSEFHLLEIARIPVYLHVKEDGQILYGFSSKEEKEIFLRLISVSGIGPKTAIGIVGNSSVSSLIQAIETGNTAALKKLPGIGPKAAQQIILDLKGKLIFDTNDKVKSKQNPSLEDAKGALKSLGFKSNEIDIAMNQLSNENHSTEEYLRLALKILKK